MKVCKLVPLLLRQAVFDEAFLALASLILGTEDLNSLLDVKSSTDRGEVWIPACLLALDKLG
jgi:hypothetical protein